MTRRSKTASWLCILLLAAVAVLHFRDHREKATTKQDKWLRNWQQLEHCRLLPNHNNDGDSFLVQHSGGTHTFRLYFVDCPEKDLRNDNRQRLEDQARYFGLGTPEEAVRIGGEARAFTLRLLERPFQVMTRWEAVYDSGRRYAQVLVQQPDGCVRDLAELLVENGLCRIYTKGAPYPNGSSEAQTRNHLQKLEHFARKRKAGAWSG